MYFWESGNHVSLFWRLILGDAENNQAACWPRSKGVGETRMASLPAVFLSYRCMYFSKSGNHISLVLKTIKQHAGQDQKVWEKPEWPAASLSLALTQLGARWESLVSDIGMAGPSSFRYQDGLHPSWRYQNSFRSKGVGWMTGKCFWPWLISFVGLFSTVYFQMCPQRVFTQILGWLANPFELFWIKISLMDDRKVLLTLGTGTVARAQNHSDFLLKEWNVT